MSPQEKDECLARMEKALLSITEFFDSVQITTTKTLDGSTFSFNKGSGNWYARVQAAREFVEADQARTHFSEAPPSNPPDDSERWK